MHIMPALFSALWAVLSIKYNASIMQALKRFFGALFSAGKFTLARLILVIGLWYAKKQSIIMSGTGVGLHAQLQPATRERTSTWNTTVVVLSSPGTALKVCSELQ